MNREFNRGTRSCVDEWVPRTEEEPFGMWGVCRAVDEFGRGAKPSESIQRTSTHEIDGTVVVAHVQARNQFLSSSDSGVNDD